MKPVRPRVTPPMRAAGVARGIIVGLALGLTVAATGSPAHPQLAVGLGLCCGAWFCFLAWRAWRTRRRGWLSWGLGLGALGFFARASHIAFGDGTNDVSWLLSIVSVALAIAVSYCVWRESKVRPEEWRATAERFERATLSDFLLGRHLI